MEVDLIIRGFCCLRPGVPGVIGNLRIRSVVGRFLEHARVFHFANGADDPFEGEYFIGSADWMDRNVTRRVEAIAPVDSRHLRERLWEVLQVQLEDQRNAWQMQPDGSYVQLLAADGASETAREGTHVTLMKRSQERLRR